AAILQHTAEYIYQLEQEKTRLLSQNSQLKRLVSSQMSQDSDGSSRETTVSARQCGFRNLGETTVVGSLNDEGIAGMSLQEAECKEDASAREAMELRMQFDRERQLRLILEEQVRSFEAQLYPDRSRDPASHHKVKAEVSRPLNTTTPSRPSKSDLSTHSTLVSATPPAPPPPVTVPASKEEGRSACASPYHASTSRQNLETIVEAIRHLEGDHLFRDDEPSLPSRCAVASEDGGSILRSSLNVVVMHE
ncbi:adaptor protein complex-4 (AP-4), putative, partial [Ixodes scapularis]